MRAAPLNAGESAPDAAAAATMCKASRRNQPAGARRMRAERRTGAVEGGARVVPALEPRRRAPQPLPKTDRRP